MAKDLEERVNALEEEDKEDRDDPDIVESLSKDVQEGRTDANKALEGLMRNRDDLDERIRRVAARLTRLEEEREKVLSARKKSDGHQKKERDPEYSDDESSSGSSSGSRRKDLEEGSRDSRKGASGSEKRDETPEDQGRKSRKAGVDSFATLRDEDEEPEDIASRRGHEWEGLEELTPTNYLFQHLLSYRTYRLRNSRTRLTQKRRSPIKRIRREIPPKLKKEITFEGSDGVLVLDFLAKIVQD